MRAIASALIFLSSAAGAGAQAIFMEPTPTYLIFGRGADGCVPLIRDARRGQESRPQTPDAAEGKADRPACPAR
jgi:hypothetical protein